MAGRGYEPLPDFDDYDYEENDDRADQTTPFLTSSASTPYGQQLEMKKKKKEKKLGFLKLLMLRLPLVEEKQPLKNLKRG